MWTRYLSIRATVFISPAIDPYFTRESGFVLKITWFLTHIKKKKCSTSKLLKFPLNFAGREQIVPLTVYITVTQQQHAVFWKAKWHPLLKWIVNWFVHFAKPFFFSISKSPCVCVHIHVGMNIQNCDNSSEKKWAPQIVFLFCIFNDTYTQRHLLYLSHFRNMEYPVQVAMCLVKQSSHS